MAYDLKQPGQRYAELIADLKSFGTYWHHLDSTWLVKTDLTPVQLRDRLKQYLDSGDELLLLDVSEDAAAWIGFSKSASEWLKQHL